MSGVCLLFLILWPEGPNIGMGDMFRLIVDCIYLFLDEKWLFLVYMTIHRDREIEWAF
jgi:hypothetical protein